MRVNPSVTFITEHTFVAGTGQRTVSDFCRDLLRAHRRRNLLFLDSSCNRARMACGGLRRRRLECRPTAVGTAEIGLKRRVELGRIPKRLCDIILVLIYVVFASINCTYFKRCATYLIIAVVALIVVVVVALFIVTFSLLT